MTAFDCGRGIEVYGTLAALKGGEPYHEAGTPKLWLRHHAEGNIESLEIYHQDNSGYAGHGGGDWGLVNAFKDLFQGPLALQSGLDGIDGHRLAFMAEEARLTRTVMGA
jgi:hypothetical protein